MRIVFMLNIHIRAAAESFFESLRREFRLEFPIRQCSHSKQDYNFSIRKEFFNNG